MNMTEKLSHYKQSFDIKFADYFIDLIAELSLPEKSIYPQICIDLIRKLSLIGGKRQRVAYLYETFRLFNSEVSLKNLNLIACAISIELLQTHLLIHDDIIDNSPTRRGVPTTLFSLQEMLNSKDSAPLGMAIMAGDIAAYLAIQVLLKNDLPASDLIKIIDVQLRAGLDTFHGQIFDIERDLPQTILTEVELAILADYKAVRSSTLAPMMLGLILAQQDSKENIDRITKYATNVGIAGQIQDDYLGLFGDATTTGKSSISDIKEGKHTLLIVHTLAQCTDKEKNFINGVLGNEDVLEVDVERVKTIVKQYKVDVLVKNIAKKYAQLASDEASSWENWNQEAVQFFVEASEWFVHRDI